MPKPDEHSRRDFLQGRAALRVAATKTQEMLDAASEALAAHETTGPVAHITAARRAMACEFAVRYHESDASMAEDVLAALDLIERIEDQLTIYRDHSDVIAINRAAANEAVTIDRDLFELIELCGQLHRTTSGAFDITSGPLSRVWGFLKRAGHVPGTEEIETALSKLGGEQVALDREDQAVRFLRPGIEINFNSIGKGYALDQAAALLNEAGHTDFLWHGGGSSVLARGRNRSSGRSSWAVGLKHPFRPDRRIAEFHLRDQALGTAGGATQFFEHDGTKYSHILDPRTGWPAKGVLTSTVVAPTAALADGLATAFFVMDRVEVRDFCSRNADIGAVLVCPATQSPGFEVLAYGLHERHWSAAVPVCDS